MDADSPWFTVSEPAVWVGVFEPYAVEAPYWK
jgi:hypothetical protein